MPDDLERAQIVEVLRLRVERLRKELTQAEAALRSLDGLPVAGRLSVQIKEYLMAHGPTRREELVKAMVERARNRRDPLKEVEKSITRCLQLKTLVQQHGRISVPEK